MAGNAISKFSRALALAIGRTVAILSQTMRRAGFISGFVFVLVIVYTLVQGPTLPWLARTLRLGDPEAASDLGIESLQVSASRR